MFYLEKPTKITQCTVSTVGTVLQLREVYRHLCKKRIGRKPPRYWRVLRSRTMGFSELGSRVRRKEHYLADWN